MYPLWTVSRLHDIAVGHQTTRPEISLNYSLSHVKSTVLECASDLSGFHGALICILSLCSFIWAVHTQASQSSSAHLQIHSRIRESLRAWSSVGGILGHLDKHHCKVGQMKGQHIFLVIFVFIYFGICVSVKEHWTPTDTPFNICLQVDNMQF